MSKNYKRCFKIAYIFGSILLYSVLFCSLTLLDKTHEFSREDTATDEQTILNEIYPLSWTTRLVYVWQGAWLIYSLVYVMRRLPNGVRVLDEIDLLHNGVFVYFSLGQVALTVWLLLQFNGFISFSLLALVIGQMAVYTAVFVSFKTMYKLTDKVESNYDNIKIDIYLNKFLVQNGLAALATHLTLHSTLNSLRILSHSFSIDADIQNRVLLGFVLLLLILYAYVENFILQKYFLNTFSPWFLVVCDLNSNLVYSLTSRIDNSDKPLTFQQLSFSQNFNILVGFISILLFTLKLVMFILYKTTRRHQLDKSQSHKILQHKQEKLLAFLQRAHEEKYNQFDSIHYFKI